MKIISPFVSLLDIPSAEKILKLLEIAGRTCYKSEDKIQEGSAEPFVRKILSFGHESVIEHEKATVSIICDRGVTHELVRHRLASYSQESTRYCNYGTKNEITVILPIWYINPHKLDQEIFYGKLGNIGEIQNEIVSNPKMTELPIMKFWNEKGGLQLLKRYLIWKDSCSIAESSYMKMLDHGATPQEARNVLPNSLKTEIVTTANLREWRHIFKLRTANNAHPQMRQVMIPLLMEFKRRIPVIFDDFDIKSQEQVD
jgi:thymidylate synthase (FAD)